MSSKASSYIKRALAQQQAYASLKQESTLYQQNFQYVREISRYYATQAEGPKTRLVVLGSGWASMTYLKRLPLSQKERYDITVVSPRNYFLYTPLLPAVASGTVEERSIVEPVRNIIHGKGKYYEATCTKVEPNKKYIMAEPVKLSGAEDKPPFQLPYDVLCIGVGTVNTTFGTPGVQEHCLFFKSIEDANNLRRRVSDRFEQASLPSVSEEEKQKLLSFIVVGGGPTGVEVAAEMHDIVMDDLKRAYPSLVPFCKVTVIEMMPSLLAMYSKEAQKFTIEQFKKHNIGSLFQTKVSAVQPDHVVLQSKDGETHFMPYGLCVWATGVALNPLVKQVQDSLDQGGRHFKGVAVNKHLCARETNGSLYVFGDAATIMTKKAFEYAEELFTQGDVNHDGKLQLGELANLLMETAKDQEFEHLKEHSNFLQNKLKRKGGLQRQLKQSGVKGGNPAQIMGGLTESSELTLDEFKELLKQMDSRISPLPPTAQVAKQEAEYLAKIFSKYHITGQKDMSKETPPFEYTNMGAAAYIGQDRAVVDFGTKNYRGYGAGWAWKGFETLNQISFRNQVNVAWDWFRVKVFGRDMSRF